MAATEAEIAYEMGLEVETAAGSGVYFELGEVTEIPEPNEQVDQQEATHMKSPGRRKEFVAGLTDPGDMAIQGNYIHGSPTDAFIKAWRLSGENRSTRIVFEDATGTEFPSFVTGYDKPHSVGQVRKFTLNLKVAGDLTDF